MFVQLPPLQNLQDTHIEIISTRTITPSVTKQDIEILRLERENNFLKQELKTVRKSRNTWKQKYLVSKGEKKVIRQIDLTRMMRVDSNLNRLTVETILNAKRYYLNLRVKPEGLERCPISNEVITLVSMFLRNNYNDKETKLKQTYHFKEEPYY